MPLDYLIRHKVVKAQVEGGKCVQRIAQCPFKRRRRLRLAGVAVLRCDRFEHLRRPVEEQIASDGQLRAHPFAQRAMHDMPQLLVLYRRARQMLQRAAIPFRVTACCLGNEQGRGGVVQFEFTAQPQFDRTRLANGVGLYQKGFVEIEEGEIARMQALEAVQRVTRKSELEDVFVATRNDVDE